ncbi:plastocyanin [Halostagnicola sp. A-GB9-2]|uniref:cupredoxin domain-containing protein n=1 Tax=Halostagnicola sp. A-GB9-2 TaxID=3048066 RepID=UPI0024BFADAD|nr:plastocyanin [Halostagnicola sp. A-GB9-2]MDJ1431646.1 plastocyanin [Halostagnicola sp. A-GB9-2]
MERPDSVARRQTLKLAGSVTGTALVAGCLSGDDSDDGSNSGNETSSGGNETTNGGGDDDGSNGGDESDSANGESNEKPHSNTDPEAWEGVDEIVLSATTSSWEGLEPDPIEGVENPTLVLTAGNEYVITWENADGQSHNLEIWDDDEEVVGDYSTELMAEENETQSLEIVAAEEMAEYTCEVHVDWGKRGDIEIESAE